MSKEIDLKRLRKAVKEIPFKTSGLRLNIEKTTVKAKARKLKTSWSCHEDDTE